MPLQFSHLTVDDFRDNSTLLSKSITSAVANFGYYSEIGLLVEIVRC